MYHKHLCVVRNFMEFPSFERLQNYIRIGKKSFVSGKTKMFLKKSRVHRKLKETDFKQSQTVKNCD